MNTQAIIIVGVTIVAALVFFIMGAALNVLLRVYLRWQINRPLGLRPLALHVASFLGGLIRRSSGAVVIPCSARVMSLCALIIAVTASMIALLKGMLLLVFCLLWGGVFGLVILTKIILVGEDYQIMNGLLDEEHAMLRNVQGAVPMLFLLLATVLLWLSFLFSLVALDQLASGWLFHRHAQASTLDGLFSLLSLLPGGTIVPDVLPKVGLVFLQPTGAGALVFRAGQWVLIVVFAYSALKMVYQSWKSMIEIEHGLRSDDSNVPFIQRRASIAPYVIKKRIITMALNQEETVAARTRAISVAEHAPIVSFPQAFLFNLHKEAEERVKEKGLRVCLALLRNPKVQYSDENKARLLKRVNHQRFRQRKEHSSECQKLLSTLKQALS